MDVISSILTSVFVTNPKPKPKNFGVQTEQFEETLELTERVEREHVETGELTEREEREPMVTGELTDRVEREPMETVELTDRAEHDHESVKNVELTDRAEHDHEPVVSAPKENEHIDNEESAQECIENVVAVGDLHIQKTDHFLLVNQSNQRNLELMMHLFDKMNTGNYHKTIYILSENRELVSDIKRLILDKQTYFDGVKLVDLETLSTKRRGSKKWLVIVEYDSIDESFLNLKKDPFNFVILVDRYSSEIWNFTNHLAPSVFAHIPKGKIANRMLYKKVLRDFASELTEESVAELGGKTVMTYDNKNLLLF